MPEKDGARITPPSVRGFPPENDEKGRFLRNRSFFARLLPFQSLLGFCALSPCLRIFLNFSLRPVSLPPRFFPSLRLRFPAFPSSSRPRFFSFIPRPSAVLSAPLPFRPSVVRVSPRNQCLFPVGRLPFPFACGLFPNFFLYFFLLFRLSIFFFLLLSFTFSPDFLPFPRGGPAPSFYFLFYY